MDVDGLILSEFLFCLAKMLLTYIISFLLHVCYQSIYTLMHMIHKYKDTQSKTSLCKKWNDLDANLRQHAKYSKLAM